LEEINAGLKTAYRELVKEGKDLSAEAVKRRFLGDDKEHQYSLFEAVDRNYS
jgi:hypothetical protein